MLSPGGMSPDGPIRLHLSERSSTGYLGVRQTRRRGQQTFEARHGGRYLGCFPDAMEAAVAYARAHEEAEAEARAQAQRGMAVIAERYATGQPLIQPPVPPRAADELRAHRSGRRVSRVTAERAAAPAPAAARNDRRGRAQPQRRSRRRR
jgi:hypothetical protein